jgi:hypothetical protein
MSTDQNIPAPTGYDIYWERWVDAYSNDSISNFKSYWEQVLLEELQKQEMTEEELALSEEIQGASAEDNIDIFEKPIKTIMTPFGILPLTEQSLASSHFKFWVGHTNFKLFENYIEIIESCDGVESVNVFTPYRFRISVGKMFTDRDVMNDIRLKLLATVVENELKK